MSTEPVFIFSHQDLHSDHLAYTQAVNSELTDLPSESESGSILSVQRLSSVAIYTLAALAAQDFTHQALAAPVIDFAQQPSMGEMGEGTARISTEKTATAQARLAQVRIAVASPESLNVQEFAPETIRVSSNSGEEQAVVPSPENLAPQSTRAGIAPPETEVRLARTLVQTEQSDLIKELETGEKRAGEGENSFVQLQNSQPTLTLAQHNGERAAALTPIVQESLVAQSVPQSSCLAYAPTSQQAATCQKSGNNVTQVALTQTSRNESMRRAEDLQQELRDLENVKVDDAVEASPGLSIYIPTAFGADNNTGFISSTYQQRTRFSNVDDGGLGIGIGLGDAQKAVGVELSYTAASFGGSRDFGAGGFNAKIHRRFPKNWAVAAGWNGFLNLGGPNDFEQSLYGVVSKVIRTRDDINLPFSRVALTAGVGNGQFRSESAVEKGSDGVGVFGNIAVRVAKPVSVIAEWTGQDLGFGLSVAPFKNIPLVITPAVRDVVGGGDGPRFVLGTGLAFKF